MLKQFIPCFTFSKRLHDAFFNLGFQFRGFAKLQNVDLTENRKLVQLSLQKLLKITPILAVGIVTSNDKFTSTNQHLLAKNYKLCTNENISTETILKCPLILVQTDLFNKIQNIKEIPVDLNNTIFLSLLRTKILKLFINSIEGPLWRIEKLCNLFSISESKVCELLGKRPFLLTIDLGHLESNLKHFMDIGISKEDMLKDVWIFKYSEIFLLKRFDIFKEHGIKEIKTWMIRCPEERMLKHIQKETDNRNILGDYSAAEYLSFKLNCSESVVDFIINKHQQLKSTSVLKLCQTIDFLYKYGFTSQQICRIPKILLHSTKTTEKRIKELTSVGVSLRQINLYVLTKSQKQYMQYFESMIKNKSKI